MVRFQLGAEGALQAAIDFQLEVQKYNQLRSDVGHQAIEVGIGIHHGRLILGTIGESQRMEGTVISDAVNIASRLESLNKALQSKKLLS